ncbi:unnamed protein product [Coffea canephora]|uniref:Uncharacterized protein n=1 Tax=Coffea canephora TaxID=49390 RepID=A0A068UWQ9_COFCA|nr:unnamed protein product [Coffea canephora]
MCDTFQARDWRKRRADMSVYSLFPPSKGKGTSRKQTVHRLLDESDDAGITILGG